MVRLPAQGLEFGCFRIAYGGLRCFDERMVGAGTRASQGWRIQGRVRRLDRRIPRTGTQVGYAVNLSVDEVLTNTISQGYDDVTSRIVSTSSCAWKRRRSWS